MKITSKKITKQQIRKGLENGYINLIKDPNLDHGTVCAIAHYWFYFGGETAENENPEEYRKNIPIKDIVNDIFNTLENFRTNSDFKDEYKFYTEYITEQEEKLYAKSIIDSNNTPCLCRGVAIINGKRKTIYGFPFIHDNTYYIMTGNARFAIIPETLGQYTGRKFWNIPLFKDDIVEWDVDYDDFDRSRSETYHGICIWDNENSCWTIESRVGDEKFHTNLNEFNSTELTIIGNIHIDEKQKPSKILPSDKYHY